MDAAWRTAVRRQFGAAIDQLENPLLACHDDLWTDRSRGPGSEFWCVAYHALFWLDLYLSGSVDGFAPPAPFTVDELTPLPPERPYTKDELRAYLDHCRRKCRATIGALTEEAAARRCGFPWTEASFSFAELLLYNMRHVPEHAAQLSLLLGQRTGGEARWVDRAQDGPGGA